MTGLKLKPRCPNCGGLLYWDNDAYENYFTCLNCAKEFNPNLISRRMTPRELRITMGIKLPHAEEYVRMRVE